MKENPGGNRKLTDEQARQVRVLYARGYRSQNQLAAEYGMTQAGISAVIQGSSYKKAGGPITWPSKDRGFHTLTGLIDRTPLEVRFESDRKNYKVRGHCRLCFQRPIASSGWAQRMHVCEDCYRDEIGGKKGRTARGKTLQRRCPVCGALFKYYRTDGGFKPKTCSPACAVQSSASRRLQRPVDLTRDRLYEWYWGLNLTTKEIAKRIGRLHPSTVRLWLIADDIPLRAPNWRTSPICVVENCGAPRHELFNGKVRYGRLCLLHLREREKTRRQIYEATTVAERSAHLLSVVSGLLQGLPDSVKADAQQDIVLAVFADELPLPLTRESVRPFIVRAFRENADAWKFVSLAAPTRDGDDAQTWGERLGIA